MQKYEIHAGVLNPDTETVENLFNPPIEVESHLEAIEQLYTWWAAFSHTHPQEQWICWLRG
jgi:hypothetical protein